MGNWKIENKGSMASESSMYACILFPHLSLVESGDLMQSQ